MKTVFINASPKKRFSASDYFLDVQKCFVRGKKVREKLRNAGDYERILNTLRDADTVIFCLPLFVDGVPSHVLSFMKKMEVFCKENQLTLKVYVISNGGFIEGNQNEALLQVFENFCRRSSISFGGGIGIGGGVMLNVLRLVLYIQMGILLLNIFVSGVQYNNWIPIDVLSGFASSVLTIIFLNLGVFFYTLRMGMAINKGAFWGKKYTRILIPSIIFIPIADFFFAIISLFKGGIFRGWFSKK